MKKKYFLISCSLIVLFSITMYSQNKPFVPKDFKIPDTLENQHLRIRMLTVNDVVKDYDAVMTSIDHLKEMYPISKT